MKAIGRLAASLVCVLSTISAYADTPTIDPKDDAKHFGKPENILFWTPEQKVAGFRNQDRLAPTRAIPASDSPYPLVENTRDIGNTQVKVDGEAFTVDEYFSGNNVAGLLVIKDSRVVYERYGLGNTRDSRWISFSVAKSVTSLLIGAAIEDGYIAAVDESVTDYLPRLKNSSYDESNIENLLQMASGVQWNEDYADPESDVASASWATRDLYEYLRHKKRDAKPGEVFNYNTAETNLAGTLLRSAIGNNLATYLAEKVWMPFGMEADASWNLTEPGGGEFGGCCINATLRDYGRLGLFALNDGRLPNGERVLPENWMASSTAPSKGSAGYGYFWWLFDGGIYAALGIFGQAIYVFPSENVVVAQHSAWNEADNNRDWQLQLAVASALAAALK